MPLQRYHLEKIYSKNRIENEAQIRKDAQKTIETPEKLDSICAEYKKRWPNLVNVDYALELFDVWKQDPTKASPALLYGGPATQIAKKLFDDYLADPKVNGFAFVWGGPGSGKSHAIASSQDFKKIVENQNLVIYDRGKGSECVERSMSVLHQQKHVMHVLVERDPLSAAKATLKRASEEKRCVPLEGTTYLNVENRELYKKTMKESSTNPRLSFGLFKNNGKKEDLQFIQGESLVEYLGNMPSFKKRETFIKAYNAIIEESNEKGRPSIELLHYTLGPQILNYIRNRASSKNFSPVQLSQSSCLGKQGSFQEAEVSVSKLPSLRRTNSFTR